MPKVSSDLLFTAARNLAFGRPTSQSSTYYDAVYGLASSSRAVDGNTNYMFQAKSCQRTNPEPNPFWKVSLDSLYQLLNIQIFNRLDGGSERLTNVEIAVSNDGQDFKQVAFNSDNNQYKRVLNFNLYDQNVTGQHVRILLRSLTYTTLHMYVRFGYFWYVGVFLLQQV